MGGKASLLIVLGFSLIFMVYGRQAIQLSATTTENVASYFYKTRSHHMAVSGVNMIVNKIFLDPNLADNTYTFFLDRDTIKVKLETIDSYLNIKRLLSTGYSAGNMNTIKIILKPSQFSKYAYFSNEEGGVNWTNQDTIYGPMHTNGDISIIGSPVFFGKVSIGGNIDKGTGYKPSFLGGLQQNLKVTIPPTGVSSVNSALTTLPGGKKFTGKSVIYLEFRKDSIRYRYSTSGAYTYELASAMAPNGIIYCDKAEVHIKGTVKGNYSIAASGTSGSEGQIFIDDDVVYNTNPITTPSSTDMLGIIAERNVIITDNTANNTGGVKIQASIYAQNGSFTAQNYSTRTLAGAIQLLGGITQNNRGAVGTVSGTTLQHGFSKSYRYDNRLLVSYPPAFPGCGTFEIVSWFE